MYLLVILELLICICLFHNLNYTKPIKNRNISQVSRYNYASLFIFLYSFTNSVMFLYSIPLYVFRVKFGEGAVC